MFRDAEARGLLAASRTGFERRLGELRELPDGIATRVRADLLIADVLEPVGSG